jgi:hypothetical protein
MEQNYQSSNIDFSNSTEVIGAGTRYIIFPGRFEGKPILDPDHGTLIKDWNNNTIEGSGFVFKNKKDNALQSIKDNGTSVIIINSCDEIKAKLIDEKITKYHKINKSENIKMEQIIEILEYINNDLELIDVYDSDTNYVINKLEKLNNGLYIKIAENNICKAIYLNGKGSFEGPAITPQRFENGAVIINDGKETRLVQTDVFLKTYLDTNGNKIEDVSIIKHHI